MTPLFRNAVILALLLSAGSAGATLPERVPPEIGELPPGRWVLEPLPGRPCNAVFCEAGSYQPPFKLYVRETRSEKWGNQTTYIAMVDGCEASADSFETTTGLSVADRVSLVRTRLDAAATALAEWCRVSAPRAVDAQGSAVLFERFDAR